MAVLLAYRRCQSPCFVSKKRNAVRFFFPYNWERVVSSNARGLYPMGCSLECLFFLIKLQTITYPRLLDCPLNCRNKKTGWVVCKRKVI